MTARRYAAVDLGASSGRVMVSDGWTLTEVHRFRNGHVRAGGTLHWDVLGLYREVLEGLRRAGPLDSIGIDSWAVDYGLLKGGALLGNPVHYRDSRTDGMKYPDLYAVTGVAELPFNTVNQLRVDPLVPFADRMLLIPDLLAYWLTGVEGAEVTNASTTGLLDARTREWAWPLIAGLGLPERIFPALRRPGDVIGPLRADVAAELGYQATVVAVASHDTASAVAAVPASGPFAYISCGTWSLVGVELDAPVLTEESRAAGFTNEAGVGGTVRYLRNVMGLWLLQESLRAWGDPPLEPLLEAAAASPPFAAVVDPDRPEFLPPGDMPARIAAECVRTGQRPPQDRAALVRCVLESLALGHREAVRTATALSGAPVEVVHLVGGGSRNALLCQLTADATGLPVLAGPVEATALGNIATQAGTGDLATMRERVATGNSVARYEPLPAIAPWDEVSHLVGK